MIDTLILVYEEISTDTHEQINDPFTFQALKTLTCDECKEIYTDRHIPLIKFFFSKNKETSVSTIDTYAHAYIGS